MLRNWFLATRPKTLPAAIAPVLLGSALALREGLFDLTPAVLCLLFAVILQITANFANDYYDGMRGTDTLDRLGPTRAVAAGLIKADHMRRAFWISAASGILVGSPLILWGGWVLLPLGLLCAAAAIAYTGGPFPFAYNGLGEFFVFLFFGLVAVCGTVYVQTGGIPGEAWWIAVGHGALASNLLVVNNYRDYAEDRRAQKKTLIVRFGPKFGLFQFQFQAMLALIVPLLLFRQDRDPFLLLPLILWPASVRLRQSLAQARTRQDFSRCLGRSAFLMMAYAFLFFIALSLP